MATLNRLLLCVVAISAGTRMPGYAHSHDDGDQPHDHAVDPGQVQGHLDHHHSHGSHGHSHRHVRADTWRQSVSGELRPASTAASDSHRHVHVAVLGLEIWFPASDEDKGTDFSSVERLISVMPAQDQLPNPFGKSAAAIDVVDVPAIAASLDSFETPRRSLTPVVAAPLCDAARHERSGVQLS